jgi:hypothetical protein
MGDEPPRVDRSLLTVMPLSGDHDDAEYWSAKTPQERLEALELMRRLQYGERATQGLQRVLTVAQLDGQPRYE